MKRRNVKRLMTAMLLWLIALSVTACSVLESILSSGLVPLPKDPEEVSTADQQSARETKVVLESETRHGQTTQIAQTEITPSIQAETTPVSTLFCTEMLPSASAKPDKNISAVSGSCREANIYGGVVYRVKDLSFLLSIDYEDGSYCDLITGEGQDEEYSCNIASFVLDAGEEIILSFRWRETVIPVRVYANCGYSRRISVRLLEKIQNYQSAEGRVPNIWDEELYQYLAARAYDQSRYPQLGHAGNWLWNNECLAENSIGLGKMDHLTDYVEECAEQIFQQWKNSEAHNRILLQTGDTLLLGAAGCYISSSGKISCVYQSALTSLEERAERYDVKELLKQYIHSAFALQPIDHEKYPHIGEQ